MDIYQSVYDIRGIKYMSFYTTEDNYIGKFKFYVCNNYVELIYIYILPMYRGKNYSTKLYNIFELQFHTLPSQY